MKQIFVSSTFKDMHIERDLIQTKLSPDLNEEAYNKRVEGIQFQDLRWGIDADLEDEIENDKKILEVCLDEIQNNRPYFCVLLGDRYGWIPDSDLVKATGRRYGIYEEDEEIDKSITHLEIDYGFLKNPQFRENSFAYIRNIKGDVSGTIYETNPEEKARMDELKREIRRVLPAENVHEYDVIYDNGKLIGVDSFIDLAKKDMTRVVLDSQLTEENLTENEKEIIYHKTQASEKSVISNARKSVEDAVIANIGRENIITIKGESGNGKSTIMSKISKRLEKDYNSIILFSSLTPKTTTASGLMRIITEYINENLAESKLTLTEAELNDALEDFNSEQEALANPTRGSLSRSKEERLYEQALKEYFVKGDEEIIILIDAIDQLDNPRAVEALLKPINFTNKSKIKFVISFLEEENTADNYMFLNDYLNYKLEELSHDDRLEVINSSLKTNNKELPHSVKEEIINKEGSKSPLYISLLVQRLVMMNSEDFDNITKAGDNYHTITRYQKNLIKEMPNDLKELIIELISQAAVNLDTNIAEVYQTMDYLGLSRRGLRESDLKRIYDLQGKTYNALDFATLKKYLRAFFLEDRYLRTDFTHKIIRHAILENISEDRAKSLHNDIANAFMLLPIEDPIKLGEQYYSAYKAKNAPAAIELLNSLGKNANKLTGADITTAVSSITKIHNMRLDRKDDAWLKELFEGFTKIEYETRKVLLAYFVYGSYEEKTSDSIKASTYNQEMLLGYIRTLAEANSHDYDLLRIYADQLSYLGVKYTSAGRDYWTKAEDYLRYAVNLNELIYDVDRSDANKESLGNVYGNIARFYMEQDDEKSSFAKDYYERSLNIFQDVADNNPNLVNLENLAMAFNNIANLHATGDDDLELAKAYYNRTIEIITDLLKEHDSTSLKKTLAMGHINVASLYFSEDEFEQAEEWYTKAVHVLREIEASEPSLENKETLAKVYNNIADVFSSELIDDKEDAEKFYNRAITIFESILRHKPIVSAKKNLSIAYDNLGNLYADWKIDKSYAYYEKAIKLRESLLNENSEKEDYTDLATSYNNLAFHYVDNRQRLELAVGYYHKASDILHMATPDMIDKKYGEDLAVVYTNLGALYFILGDVENSDTYYRKAIHIHKLLIEEFEDDDNIEKLLIIYENIAVNKADLDYSMEEIEADYKKVIDLIKVMKDPYKKVKKTAITYGNLGNFYLMRENNFKLAEDCYLKSAYLTRKVVEYHDSVENIERLAVVNWNLAVLYGSTGQTEKQEECMKLVAELMEEINYDSYDENLNKFIHLHRIASN